MAAPHDGTGGDAAGRAAGAAAVGAGTVTLLTVAHFAAVMPAAGFELAMFDDRATLLAWLAVEGHVGLYRMLFVLAFAAQALLLPAPWAVRRLLRARGGAGPAVEVLTVVASAALAASLVGPVSAFASAGPVAEAYAAGERATAVLLGDLFADVAKDVRLFTNVLVGTWLAAAGAAVARVLRRRLAGRGLAALGIVLALVSAYKLVDPATPVEDVLSPFLAVGYLALGVVLLGRGRPRRS